MRGLKLEVDVLVGVDDPGVLGMLLYGEASSKSVCVVTWEWSYTEYLIVVDLIVLTSVVNLRSNELGVRPAISIEGGWSCGRTGLSAVYCLSGKDAIEYVADVVICDLCPNLAIVVEHLPSNAEALAPGVFELTIANLRDVDPRGIGLKIVISVLS